MAGRRRRPSNPRGSHFLDSRHAAELATAAGVGPGDLVLDLGAGHGSLTAALAGRGARVIAVERDPRCLASLRRRFAKSDVVVVERDVLELALPRQAFSVVSNIPFGATTELLGRLLDPPRSELRFAHLVVASGAARKFVNARSGSSRILWWAARYRLRVGARLHAGAFNPRPAADAAVLIAEPREQPLITASEHRAFIGLLEHGLGDRSASFEMALRAVFTNVQIRRLAGELSVDRRDPVHALTVDQWARVTHAMIQLVDPARRPKRMPTWVRSW